MSARLLALLSFAVLFPSGQDFASKPRRVVREFVAGAKEAPYDISRFLFSPEVTVDEKDGTVRLARSVLLSDEMGTTDFHQTETLGDRVRARKLFVLNSPEAAQAELFFFGTAKRIEVNGKEISPPQKLVSTGWSRAVVP